MFSLSCFLAIYKHIVSGWCALHTYLSRYLEDTSRKGPVSHMGGSTSLLFSVVFSPTYLGIDDDCITKYLGKIFIVCDGWCHSHSKAGSQVRGYSHLFHDYVHNPPLIESRLARDGPVCTTVS